MMSDAHILRNFLEDKHIKTTLYITIKGTISVLLLFIFSIRCHLMFIAFYVFSTCKFWIVFFCFYKICSNFWNFISIDRNRILKWEATKKNKLYSWINCIRKESDVHKGSKMGYGKWMPKLMSFCHIKSFSS